MECTHCGMPLNNANAVWSPGPNRDPFCSEECMELERRYTND